MIAGRSSSCIRLESYPADGPRYSARVRACESRDRPACRSRDEGGAEDFKRVGASGGAVVRGLVGGDDAGVEPAGAADAAAAEGRGRGDRGDGPRVLRTAQV